MSSILCSRGEYEMSKISGRYLKYGPLGLCTSICFHYAAVSWCCIKKFSLRSLFWSAEENTVGIDHVFWNCSYLSYFDLKTFNCKQSRHEENAFPGESRKDIILHLAYGSSSRCNEQPIFLQQTTFGYPMAKTFWLITNSYG